MRRSVLVVFETLWDRPQLEACRRSWEDRYAIEFSEPSDADSAWDLDVLAWIDREAERRRGSIAGVFSSSDYPGATVAGAISSALGLPGPPAQAVLRASQKHESRIAQRAAVPEAVPWFVPLDPDDPATWEAVPEFPCFVKPVKGAFSILSERIASRDELEAFLRSERVRWFRTEFMAIFDQLARRFGLEKGGRWFLAEELLRGDQATVEVWLGPAGGGVLGVVDSTFRPGTRSFERFDYPSALPADLQERMGDVALRAGRELGLVGTVFNVEMLWDPEADRLRIVEVNPRPCGQFADLYEKVDGVNGYEVALALAAGDEPPRARGEGPFAVAASFPLRVYDPVRVRSVPDAERLREVAAAHPGALLWLECRAGDELARFDELEDGASWRYGVVNVGGTDRDDLRARCDRIRDELGLAFEPLAIP